MASNRTPKKKQTSTRRSGVSLAADERQRTMEEFLKVFAQTGNLMLSCRAVNIGRSSIYYWIEHDMEGFAEHYAEAEQEACEALEAEAYRRAVQGVEEPVHYQGQRIDTVRRYSDVLLIFLLKGRMPEKYRENMAAVAVAGASIASNTFVFDGQTKSVQMLSDAELDMAEAILKREDDEG